MNWYEIGAVETRRMPDGHMLGRLEWEGSSAWVCDCASFLATARWYGRPNCKHIEAVMAVSASSAAQEDIGFAR